MSMFYRYEKWLEQDVIPHLDAQLVTIVEAWRAEVAALVQEVNSYLKAQTITVTIDADGFGTITLGAD